ncbi:TFIIS N-terminal domain-containing protein [Balamuthia mandrillaris]
MNPPNSFAASLFGLPPGAFSTGQPLVFFPASALPPPTAYYPPSGQYPPPNFPSPYTTTPLVFPYSMQATNTGQQAPFATATSQPSNKGDWDSHDPSFFSRCKKCSNWCHIRVVSKSDKGNRGRRYWWCQSCKQFQAFADPHRTVYDPNIHPPISRVLDDGVTLLFKVGSEPEKSTNPAASQQASPPLSSSTAIAKTSGSSATTANNPASDKIVSQVEDVATVVKEHARLLQLHTTQVRSIYARLEHLKKAAGLNHKGQPREHLVGSPATYRLHSTSSANPSSSSPATSSSHRDKGKEHTPIHSPCAARSKTEDRNCYNPTTTRHCYSHSRSRSCSHSRSHSRSRSRSSSRTRSMSCSRTRSMSCSCTCSLSHSPTPLLRGQAPTSPLNPTQMATNLLNSIAAASNHQVPNPAVPANKPVRLAKRRAKANNASSDLKNGKERCSHPKGNGTNSSQRS